MFRRIDGSFVSGVTGESERGGFNCFCRKGTARHQLTHRRRMFEAVPGAGGCDEDIGSIGQGVENKPLSGVTV